MNTKEERKNQRQKYHIVRMKGRAGGAAGGQLAEVVLTVKNR